MKKRISIRKIMGCLGFLLLLTGLTACGKTETPAEEKVFQASDYTLTVPNVQDFDMKEKRDYQEETDWDWSYINIHTMSAFAKGEMGYYVRLDEFVYFCDFDKGTLTPVCNRPDCLHDKETERTKREACIAYLPWGGKGEGIQYYEGKLYANVYANDFVEENDRWFSGDKLVAISPDGSSREILDYELEECYNFMIHRGSIYYTLYNTDPETLVNTQSVYRVDMESGEKTLLVRVDGWPTLRVYPIGNYVYIFVMSNEEATVQDVIYEISTGRAKVEEGKPSQSILPTKGETLTLCTRVGDNNVTIENLNMDGSEREKTGELSLKDLEDFKFEEGTTPLSSFWLGADDSYFYMFGLIDGYSEEDPTDMLDHPIEAVFDRDTCELLRIFELESRPPAQNFGVDDTYIFYMCDAAYSFETKVYWMKKEDILKPEAAFSVMEP